MKIIDCIWEKRNLNCKTVEVVLDKDENIKFDDISYLESKYEYIVIKVPTNNLANNLLLASNKYTFLECQYKLLKKIVSFEENDPLIDLIKKDLKFRIINTKNDFDKLLSNITDNMFSSDRICLDPQFGPEIGTKRYKNWMGDEFYKGTSMFIVASKNNEDVGFIMAKEKKNNIDALLGGIFHEFQEEGLGLLTPSFLFLAKSVLNNEYKNVITSISSNNVPVVQLYNYLNYKILNTTYVFIKHININKV